MTNKDAQNNQKINAGDNSNNFQAGNDVHYHDRRTERRAVSGKRNHTHIIGYFSHLAVIIVYIASLLSGGLGLSNTYRGLYDHYASPKWLQSGIILLIISTILLLIASYLHYRLSNHSRR